MTMKTKVAGIAALVAATIGLYAKPALGGALVEKYEFGEEMPKIVYTDERSYVETLLGQFAEARLLEEKRKKGDNKVYVVANTLADPSDKSTFQDFITHPENYDTDSAAKVHFHGTLDAALRSKEAIQYNGTGEAVVVIEIDLGTRDMTALYNQRKKKLADLKGGNRYIPL